MGLEQRRKRIQLSPTLRSQSLAGSEKHRSINEPMDLQEKEQRKEQFRLQEERVGR